MNQSNAIQDAAARLRQAEAMGQPCSPVRDMLPPKDLTSAYAVQRLNVELSEASGRRTVGYKAGLTSPAVQRQLGVDQPDFGVLFADMAMAENEWVGIGSVLQPKVEAEIALVLDRDLIAEHATLAELIRAIGFAVPAIEVVGSRVRDWDIDIVDTIADNASSGLFVLGNSPKKIRDFNTDLCGMTVECKGEQVSVGAGRACLGNPLNAALWLARTMIANGRVLKAGDILLTGALGPMATVKPGDVFEARVNGVGRVRVNFSETE